MQRRVWIPSLVVVALTVSGCGEPGQWEHDRAVARLSQQVEDEDGWLVYTLRVETAGGGHLTWWLHPCDPAIDDERDLTATMYRGSDNEDLLGDYHVEEFQVECVAPSREIPVGSRTLVTDVDVVPVWTGLGSVGKDDRRVWAHEPGPETVSITDPADGSTYVFTEDGAHAEGPCDGATYWSATWARERYVTAATVSCMDTLGALPDAVLRLLETTGEAVDVKGDKFTFTDSETMFDLQDDIERELANAEWGSAGAEPERPMWIGPCRDVGDGFERAAVSMFVIRTIDPDRSDKGRLEVTSESCDG